MPNNVTTETFSHRYVPVGINAPLTLLLLHETGGDESDLLSLGQMLRSDAALLSPRGRVLENGMPRFFRRVAPGIFDREDLIQRTHELADWIGAAVTAYGLDPAKIIAVGYSNGANIAASLMLLRPDVLREAGAEVDLRWHGGGHGLGQADVAAARGWTDYSCLPRGRSCTETLYTAAVSWIIPCFSAGRLTTEENFMA